MQLPNPNPDGTASVSMMQLSLQETSTNYLQGIFEGIGSLKTMMTSMRVFDDRRADVDDQTAAQQRRRDEETRRESLLGRAGGGLKQAATSVKNTGKDLVKGFSMSGLLSTLIGGAVLAAIFAPEKSKQLMQALQNGFDSLMGSEFFKEVEKAAKGIFKEFGWDNLLVGGIFGWRIGAIYSGLKYVGSLVKTWLGISTTVDQQKMDQGGAGVKGDIDPRDKSWIDKNFTKIFGAAGLAAILFGPMIVSTVGALMAFTLGKVALIPGMLIGVTILGKAIIDEWNDSIQRDIASGKHVSALKEATAKMAKSVMGDLTSGPAMIGAIAGAMVGIIGGPVGILLGSMVGMALGAGLNILFKSEKEIIADNKIKREFWDAIFDSLGDSILNLLNVASNTLTDYFNTMIIKILAKLPGGMVPDSLLKKMGLTREQFEKKKNDIILAEKTEEELSGGMLGGYADVRALDNIIRRDSEDVNRKDSPTAYADEAMIRYATRKGIRAERELATLSDRISLATGPEKALLEQEYVNRLSFVNKVRKLRGKNPYYATPMVQGDTIEPTNVDRGRRIAPKLGEVVLGGRGFGIPKRGTYTSEFMKDAAQQDSNAAQQDSLTKTWAEQEAANKGRLVPVIRLFGAPSPTGDDGLLGGTGNDTLETPVLQANNARTLARNIVLQRQSADQAKAQAPTIIMPPAPTGGGPGGDSNVSAVVNHNQHIHSSLAAHTMPDRSIVANLAAM